MAEATDPAEKARAIIHLENEDARARYRLRRFRELAGNADARLELDDAWAPRIPLWRRWRSRGIDA